MVNKITAAVTQIGGGLLVLHSINSNLDVFHKKSLASLISGWLKDFPFIRKSINMVATATGGATLTGHIGSVVIRAANESIEERVKRLESQLEEVRSEIQSNDSKINKRVNEVRTELLAQVSANQQAVQALAEQVKKSTVDGFKEQSFGILLVIYGAFCSIYT
jgi:hypothetical protein